MKQRDPNANKILHETLRRKEQLDDDQRTQAKLQYDLELKKIENDAIRAKTEYMEAEALLVQLKRPGAALEEKRGKKQKQKAEEADAPLLGDRYNVSLKMLNQLKDANVNKEMIYKLVHDWVTRYQQKNALDVRIKALNADTCAVYAWQKGHKRAFQDSAAEQELWKHVRTKVEGRPDEIVSVHASHCDMESMILMHREASTTQRQREATLSVQRQQGGNRDCLFYPEDPRQAM